MPKLRIKSGSSAGKEVALAETMMVGRGPLADLSLEDPEVSRRHALLRFVDGQCQVLDLESEHGTFVNRTPVSEPIRLRAGDILHFGAVAAEYVVEEPGTGPMRADSSIRVVDAPPSPHRVMMKMGPEPASPTEAGDAERGATLESLTRRVRFLDDFGKVVSQAFDETTLLSFVLDELLELVPQAERVFVMTWDAGTNRLVPRLARTRSGEPTEITVSRTLLDEVVQRREGVLVADALVDPRFSESASMRVAGIRSAVCVPILFHEELYGLIQADASRALFQKGDVASLLGIASHVGMSLAYAKLHSRLVERELLERDLLLARRIQRHFLPARPPEVAGYEFAAEYTPALAVGGDFFDFLDLAGGRIGIAVGDVSGKGVSAALYVAKLSSEVRFHSVGQTAPAEILRRVNSSLCSGSQEGMFTTMVFLVLDLEKGELVLASAGHPLALLLKGDGEVTTLGQAGGVPLGLRADATFAEHAYSLEERDIVVLYTDGITEARNREKELFGNGRLAQAVRASDGSVSGVMHSVLSAVKAFAGSESQADDLTLVSLGRKPRARD
jgi:serine phosphatase RsbU (regulator of sigma subunit)